MAQGTPEHGMEKIIDDLERQNRPISKWAAISLREIYSEDGFSLVRLRGSHDTNLKYTPQAIRLIALHEGHFMGLGIVLTSSDAATHVLGKELRVEVDKLPNVGSVDVTTNNLVTDLLLRHRKQTVAALEISTAIRDNSKMIQVLYPKLLRTFMKDLLGNLGIRTDELMEREAASVIAMRYLKFVKFTSSEPRILTPEE